MVAAGGAGQRRQMKLELDEMECSGAVCFALPTFFPSLLELNGLDGIFVN